MQRYLGTFNDWATDEKHLDSRTYVRSLPKFSCQWCQMNDCWGRVICLTQGPRLLAGSSSGCVWTGWYVEGENTFSLSNWKTELMGANTTKPTFHKKTMRNAPTKGEYANLNLTYITRQGSRIICLSHTGFSIFGYGLQLISRSPYGETEKLSRLTSPSGKSSTSWW